MRTISRWNSITSVKMQQFNKLIVGDVRENNVQNSIVRKHFWRTAKLTLIEILQNPMRIRTSQSTFLRIIAFRSVHNETIKAFGKSISYKNLMRKSRLNVRRTFKTVWTLELPHKTQNYGNSILAQKFLWKSAWPK